MLVFNRLLYIDSDSPDGSTRCSIKLVQ